MNKEEFDWDDPDVVEEAEKKADLVTELSKAYDLPSPSSKKSG
jgi:hypothetical protein